MKILLEKVCKSFSGIPILHDVSLQLEMGEKVAILGEKETGKSTLLKIVAGVEKPTSGNIFIDEKELSSVKQLDAVFIGGFTRVLFNKTVFYNLAFPLRVRKVAKKEIISSVENIAAKFNLFQLLKKRVKKISPYQQALVEIARIYMRKPKFVICDDPFLKLTEEEKINAFQLLAKNTQSACVLFATGCPEAIKLLNYKTYSLLGNLTLLNGTYETEIK